MSGWENYLVSFDTDRIKRYLLATNRLKEIRGGSALLAWMDERRKRLLTKRYGNRVVYSVGGGAAVLVQTEEEAQALIQEIERDFRERTITASITGVYLPPEPANGRNFGERMKKAGEYLRQAKAAKAGLDTLPTEPYMHLCDSCGMLPAERMAEGEDGDWLCRPCAQKRRWGGKERQGFFNRFALWADPQIWEKSTLPDDLDGIGQVSLPPNYIGFIALDGNHIGDLLSKPATIEAYRNFSTGLYDLTEKLTWAALKRFGKPRKGVAPFEIVLIGGDDVLLITAADIAIEIALMIADEFEQHSPAKVLEPGGLTSEGDRLTMAAGVVLAHADFPIPAMYQLAEALQKSAKKLCAERRYDTGAIDFLVVSGSDVDLEEMRRAIPHRRPYTLADMEKIVGYIARFKEMGFPTSQLQAMYQSLFNGKVNAQLASIATLGYLGTRPGKRKEYDTLRNFFAEFGVKFDGQLPPWDADAEERNGRRASALTDLVELYPFIHVRERGES